MHNEQWFVVGHANWYQSEMNEFRLPHFMHDFQRVHVSNGHFFFCMFMPGLRYAWICVSCKCNIQWKSGCFYGRLFFIFSHLKLTITKHSSSWVRWLLADVFFLFQRQHVINMPDACLLRSISNRPFQLRVWYIKHRIGMYIFWNDDVLSNDLDFCVYDELWAEMKIAQ